MADEIKGRDIYLIIDDDKFANEQGMTNSETMDTIEVTNKHTPDNRKAFITDTSTGTITCNGFYTLADGSGEVSYHSLKAKYLAGAAITYELGYFDTGGVIESGSALITAINLNANTGEASTFDISLQKTGAYAETAYSS